MLYWYWVAWVECTAGKQAVKHGLLLLLHGLSARPGSRL
jgi:hypothetical protein